MPTIDGDHKFTPTHPTYEELEAEVIRLRVDLTHFTPASIERAAALEAENARLRQRVEELEREKYGTPCKCEQWVKACGEAEERAEAAEAKVARLRAVVMDFHWLYGFFKDRGSVSDAVKTRLDKIDAALAPEVK